MTGSIAPNRPGHHGTVVARTVGTVAISCNVGVADVVIIGHEKREESEQVTHTLIQENLRLVPRGEKRKKMNK